MAVGCSHGHLANPAAVKSAIEFKVRWKPETTIHLGDFVDLSAFMRDGAGQSVDDSDITADLLAGEEMLLQLEPRMIFVGNHEDRLWKIRGHREKVKAWAAMTGIQAIEKLAKDLKASLVEYDIDAGWRYPLGSDCRFGHGYMYNQAAIRDHAETFGKCCIAHLHTPGQERGRRSDNPTCYCSGTLADIPAMRYAKTNRSRLRWGHGWLWGEYCSNETVVWVAERSRSGEWRLPI